MKKYISIPAILLLIFVLHLPAPTAVAQDNDDDVPELSLWRGGQLNLDFNINFNMLNVGSGSSMMGGVMSTRVQNDAASLFINPAELGNLRSRNLIFDGQMGYGSWMTSSLNQEIRNEIQSEIENETSSVITNPDNFLLQGDAYTSYTDVNTFNAGVPASFGAISVAWPLHERFVLGLGYNSPMNMSFRMQSSGISTKIAQEQGTDDVAIRFDVLMNISMLLDFTLQMNRMSVGFGSNLYEGDFGKLSLGASLLEYRVENKRRVNTDLSGMVVVGNADERFFNNPNDPNLNYDAGETNEFYMQASGNFNDRSNGFHIGAIYETPWFATLSMTYQKMPSFDLTDENAFSRAFLPIFMIGDDVLSGDLEIQLDTLRANKPNLTTERDISDLTNSARLQLPSSFKVGVDLAIKRHTIALNYTKYTDNLEFQFGNDVFGKEADHGFGFGTNFTFRDRLSGWGYALIPIRLLYLDFDGLLLQAFRGQTGYSNPQYSFGGSVMMGDSIGDDDGTIAGLFDAPLPTGFSMGRRYTLRETIRVGVNLYSVPDLFFRASLGYTF